MEPRTEADDLVIGEEIHRFYINRVVRSTTTNGQLVAIKVREKEAFFRSEADMITFIQSQETMARVRVPRARAIWDLAGSDYVAFVMDFIPGRTLDHIWPELDETERRLMKGRIRDCLSAMKTIRIGHIGRPGRQPTYNCFNPYMPTLMGPFNTEDEFDEWCIQKLPSRLQRMKWRHRLPKMKIKGGDELYKPEFRFCLTHCDLSARNIMITPQGKIVLLDWERSGFFPGWMELVCAMTTCRGMEEWWRPILVEILTDGFSYSRMRLEFFSHIT